MFWRWFLSAGDLGAMGSANVGLSSLSGGPLGTVDADFLITP
jgi:hypothetical protein